MVLGDFMNKMILTQLIHSLNNLSTSWDGNDNDFVQSFIPHLDVFHNDTNLNDEEAEVNTAAATTTHPITKK